MPAHTGSAFKHALTLSTRHAHPTAAHGRAPGALAGGFGVPRPTPRLRPISARRRLRTAAAAAAWREKTSLRAATLSSARMREASGSRCSANVSARAMRVRSRGCRSGGARNMAAAGAACCRPISASEIACVQVHRKNRRCVQRPRGRVVEARAIFCFRRGHQGCSVPGRDGAHLAGLLRRPWLVSWVVLVSH